MNLKTWYEDGIYNKEIEICFRDCKPSGHVKLSSILAHASDIGGNDYSEKGITREQMLEAEQVFLLARYHIKFFHPVVSNDILTFTTWEGGIKSGFVIRNFEIRNQKNDLCMLISSTWFIANPITRKIIRPNQFTLREIGNIQREFDCMPCEKILIKNELLKLIEERKIRYSEIDANGHLNNSCYANLILDSMPQELREKHMKDFYINYSNEAKCDDIISLYGYFEDNEYCVVGKVDGKTSFVSKIMY